MPATDILKRLPTLGLDMWQLIVRPVAFVTAWKDRTDKPSNKEVLGWALGFSALFFGLYAAVTGRSVLDILCSASPPGFCITSSPSAEAAPKPSFGRIEWQFGVTVGVFCPEASAKGLDAPQNVVLGMGPGRMWVRNVIPSKLGTKVANLLLSNLYIYLLALCLYPGFRLWTAQTSLKGTLALANLYIGTIWAYAGAAIVLATIVFVHILRFRGWRLFITWVFVVILPLTVLFVRAFWSGFRTFSGLSRSKFFGSLVAAWIISWTLSPLGLFLAFAVLRFQSLLDPIL